MDSELTLPLAFLAGLAGAGHCWAMCGGLVGGLFLSAGGPRLYPHLAYHGGRVLAYTLLGALAAGIGQAIVLTGGVGRAQGVLYVVAGVLVVLAGARVAGFPSPALPRTPPRKRGRGWGRGNLFKLHLAGSIGWQITPAESLAMPPAEAKTSIPSPASSTA
jgi:hypothetical protein